MVSRRGAHYIQAMAPIKRVLPRVSVAVFLVLIGTSVARAGSSLEGRWNTPDEASTIEVSIKDGILTGTLVASTEPRAKLGTVILRGFVRRGDKWVGKIYVPKKDRTADAEATLKDGKLTIKVSAGLRSKSVVWTRARSQKR